MMGLVARLFGRVAPTYSEARPGDAAAIAAVHGASFQRGWGEDEIHRLLIQNNVVAHRAMIGRTLIGFIMSRMAAGEAEMLELHLRRLVGLGARSVFLEVAENNTPAGRLYQRAGFYEVGRRQGYYEGGKAARVLRRDLG
jgi:ribosomal-protein-alanine N-acetyltransferase